MTIYEESFHLVLHAAEVEDERLAFALKNLPQMQPATAFHKLGYSA